MADYELVEMSFDEAAIRISELHAAMTVVERFGGASPEQTAVIVELGGRMRGLRQRHASAATRAMLEVLAVNPELATTRSTIRDLEGFVSRQREDVP